MALTQVALLLPVFGLLSPADVQRATTIRPGEAFVAPTLHAMGAVLNVHLRRQHPNAFAECDDFDVATLRAQQRQLFEHIEPELIALYPPGDKRTPRTANASALRHEHAVAPSPSDPQLQMVQRDGLCHELVLTLVHHIPSATRARLQVLQRSILLSPDLRIRASAASASPSVAWRDDGAP